jgi:E3 ubiquitin-protein ligase SHPRH
VWDGTAFLAMEECDAERRELEDKINTSRARQRYLDHIAKTKDGVNDEESNTWILVDVASSVDSSPNGKLISFARV